MARVFLSLGSNVGDRVANIQHATSALAMESTVEIIKTSSFYETEPWGNKKLDWFVNAVVAIDTKLSCEELLRLCQNIETKLGRKRILENKYEPRIIDIDILMYDNLVCTSPTLTIPHKFMHERAFVLVPMLEVKSDLIHPVFKRSMSDLYDELQNPEDVFLYGTVLPK